VYKIWDFLFYEYSINKIKDFPLLDYIALAVIIYQKENSNYYVRLFK